eukprot:152754-Chlamydomonas_euryale.AAC.5
MPAWSGPLATPSGMVHRRPRTVTVTQSACAQASLTSYVPAPRLGRNPSSGRNCTTTCVHGMDMVRSVSTVVHAT